MDQQEKDQIKISALAEAPSIALFNKLIQSQHETLVSELAKIEKLNDIILMRKVEEN